MSSNDDQRQLRVELYSRSYMPEGAESPQEEVLAWLDRLCERDVLDSCQLRVWGNRVPTDSARSGEHCREAIDTVGQFRAWAERNDVSLLPFFDERSHHSKITGEQHSEIIFPIMCLAVYRGDNLAGVYPHADDDSVVTIWDFLSSLVEDYPELSNPEPPERPGATLA